MNTIVDSEVDLVERLCAGDEAAFGQLVIRHHAAMVRLARSFVSTEAAAEDVAQEAWLAVVRGVERFEGRSTVKTWLFRILVNQAKSRGIRDARSMPFSSFTTVGDDMADPDWLVDGDIRSAGQWTAQPQRRRDTPEVGVVNAETREQLGAALDALPNLQRAVVTMRDVFGLTSAEVCAALELSEANQRVLLHRGRTKMRRLLEGYLSSASTGC